MRPTTPLTPEQLLTHRALVRGVVRALLRDEAAVDDVEQQTWIAAITRPPRDAGSLKSWLVAVARNFARKARTEESRRHRREAVVATPEAGSPVDEVREIEARRHQVVDHVLALDEPYRTAIILRFLKEMPPRRIALELDVPVETVKTRLKRGLEQLRQRLDQQHGGDRRAWMTALLPLARPKAAAGLAAAGGVLTGALTMKMILVGTAAAVIATLALTLNPSADTSRGDASFVASTAGDVESPTARDRSSVAPETERAEVAAEPIVGTTANGVVEGRVLDDDDHPAVPSRAFLVDGDGAVLEAPLDATGSYRFEGLATGTFCILLTDESTPPAFLSEGDDDLDDRLGEALPRSLSLRQSWIETPEGRSFRSHLYSLTDSRRMQTVASRIYLADVVLLTEPGTTVSTLTHVHRAARVRGSVVGPEGEPVPLTFVRLRSLEVSGLSYDDVTDRYGRYEMVGVAGGPYRVQTDGTRTASYGSIASPLPVDQEIPRGADLELAPLRFGGGTHVVTGEVVDQDGLAFADLPVHCFLTRPVAKGVPPHDWGSSILRTTTDAQGRYRLDGLPAEHVGISIASDEGLPGTEGESLLATFVDSVFLDLTDGPELRVAPRRVAERSRPFRFEGRLHIDPGLAERERLDGRDFDVTVRLAPGYARAVAEGIRRRSFLGDVDIEDDGRFTWICETPHAPVDVVIACDDGDVETQRVRLIPTPNGRVERDVRVR